MEELTEDYTEEIADYTDQPFDWTKPREVVAIALANGHTQKVAADRAGVSRATVQRWVKHPDFQDEVDRLSLMVGIASRAGRLRAAKRIVREMLKKHVPTDKDLLDWLKYIQSETDGAKLNLTALLEAYTADDEPDPAAPSHRLGRVGHRAGPE